jgi:cation diffusion facilitator CzcD-associated flavoprotein CzcO
VSHYQATPSESSLDAEVLIVGAGISGIGAGIELIRRGHPSFILLEADQDLGGTWRDNTYPGVAVDIPFNSYCYSRETDYPWSRIFPTGNEIKSYVRHCAEKYGITHHIRYNAKVLGTRFDSDSDSWLTRLSRPEIPLCDFRHRPAQPAQAACHSGTRYVYWKDYA